MTHRIDNGRSTTFCQKMRLRLLRPVSMSALQSVFEGDGAR